jgi:hypothetical protein
MEKINRNSNRIFFGIKFQDIPVEPGFVLNKENLTLYFLMGLRSSQKVRVREKLSVFWNNIIIKGFQDSAAPKPKPKNLSLNGLRLLNLKLLTDKELYDIRFKGDKTFAQKVATEQQYRKDSRLKSKSRFPNFL